MLPLRASVIALALLASALAPQRAAAQAAVMPAAAAAAPAPKMAAGAPAAENQFRLSANQTAVLEQLGLVDPAAIMADLQQAGVTPTTELPMKEGDPTIYDYVMFAFIKTGDVDAARRMFTPAAPANPNIKDVATGDTPIFSAVEQSEQNPQLLELLIQNGADTNVKRKDGATPLLLAIAGGFNQTVGLLLRGPGGKPLADPNLASTEGLTPLLAAIVSDQAGIVEQLLDAGAGPNTPGAGGELPLVDAVQAMPADPTIVEALLQAGANPYLADGSGTNAVQAAEQAGNPDILELLMQYGVAAPAAEMAGAPAPEIGAAPAAVPAGRMQAAAAAAPAAELVAAPTGA